MSRITSDITLLFKDKRRLQAELDELLAQTKDDEISLIQFEESDIYEKITETFRRYEQVLEEAGEFWLQEQRMDKYQEIVDYLDYYSQKVNRFLKRYRQDSGKQYSKRESGYKNESKREYTTETNRQPSPTCDDNKKMNAMRLLNQNIERNITSLSLHMPNSHFDLQEARPEKEKKSVSFPSENSIRSFDDNVTPFYRCRESDLVDLDFNFARGNLHNVDNDDSRSRSTTTATRLRSSEPKHTEIPPRHKITPESRQLALAGSLLADRQQPGQQLYHHDDGNTRTEYTSSNPHFQYQTERHDEDAMPSRRRDQIDDYTYRPDSLRRVHQNGDFTNYDDNSPSFTRSHPNPGYTRSRDTVDHNFVDNFTSLPERPRSPENTITQNYNADFPSLPHPLTSLTAAKKYTI